MAWNKRLFFIFILNIFISTSYATVQEDDLLIFEGSRYLSSSLPLLENVLPKEILPDFISTSSSNWKGYLSTWAIINNQLFLIGAEGRVKVNNGQKLMNSHELLPSITFPYLVNNYNGIIHLVGRRSDYERINGDKVQITALDVKIENGIVQNVSKQTSNSQERWRIKGKSLYNSSSFKAVYEKEFVISDISSMDNGKTHGVHFEEQEWSAKLSPKVECQYSCIVSAVFPINKKQVIEVSITPSEIHNILIKAFEHPFFIKMFKEADATGIRLRITGDRLHWDTSELQELHKVLKGKLLEQNEIRDWANIIIDQKRQYISVYYNRKTGELMLTESYGTIARSPRLIKNK